MSERRPSSRNPIAPSSFHPVVNKSASGGGHAETDTTRGTPRGPREEVFRRFIRTFDPDVPGYVFWPIIFGVGVIFAVVVLRGF